MKIAFCTPSRSGYVHHDHMTSFIQLLVMAAKRGDTIQHFVVPGCSLITRARNRLVAQALSQKCDYIFFVDDDIGFEAKDFFKLIDYGVDVAAAAPARRKHRSNEPDIAIYRLGPFAGPQKITQANFQNGSRLWKAEGVATAFLCIKASVFRQLERVTTVFHSTDETCALETRNWFWIELCKLYDSDKVHDMGEDYNFCFKWQEIGGDVWLDPDIRLRHYDGNVCFDTCPADISRQLSQMEK